MKLQAVIRDKLAHSSFHDIAKMMGYHKVDNKIVKRIHQICTDPDMGLYSGYYDFKYTGSEFIDALCMLLDINLSDYTAEIEAIKLEYRDREDRFRSYVFVDTGFRRAGQPIFSLIFMDSLRHLYLNYEIRVLAIAEQIDYVKRLVIRHYKDNDGKLELWGEINKYVFCYDKNKYIEFTVDGSVIREKEQLNTQKAAVYCNGEDITSWIKSVSSHEDSD